MNESPPVFYTGAAAQKACGLNPAGDLESTLQDLKSFHLDPESTLFGLKSVFLGLKSALFSPKSSLFDLKSALLGVHQFSPC